MLLLFAETGRAKQFIKRVFMNWQFVWSPVQVMWHNIAAATSTTMNEVIANGKKKKGKSTHPSRRTSGRERLRAIISDAMRLNWLILNISFIFSWFSFGITTGFPPSPGPSRGLMRASTVDTHRPTSTIRGGCGCVFLCHFPTHPLSRAALAPLCCHTCCTRWSRAGWTYPASPRPARWPGPLYSRQTSSSWKAIRKREVWGEEDFHLHTFSKFFQQSSFLSASPLIHI